MNPPGLFVFPEFISPEVEQDLLNSLTSIEPTAWNTALKRRTVHFGYEYNYQTRVADSQPIPFPSWLTPLTRQIETVAKDTFDQCIVNEYTPGQGISKHIDAPKAFGDTITSLSLGSSCVMIFRRDDTVVEIPLMPRTLLLLTGEARFKWTHEIPSRKSDCIEQQKIPRKTRYSITWRSIRASMPKTSVGRIARGMIDG